MVLVVLFQAKSPHALQEGFFGLKPNNKLVYIKTQNQNIF
jgi:hypothetical protein